MKERWGEAEGTEDSAILSEYMFFFFSHGALPGQIVTTVNRERSSPEYTGVFSYPLYFSSIARRRGHRQTVLQNKLFRASIVFVAAE